MEELEKLWNTHIQLGFPKGYGGVEIEGVELVLLDADTVGCISTFLNKKGELDLWRTANLGICYHDLALVNANIDKSVLEYFVRLEKMAKLVLQEVARKSRRA